MSRQFIDTDAIDEVIGSTPAEMVANCNAFLKTVDDIQVSMVDKGEGYADHLRSLKEKVSLILEIAKTYVEDVPDLSESELACYHAVEALRVDAINDLLYAKFTGTEIGRTTFDLIRTDGTLRDMVAGAQIVQVAHNGERLNSEPLISNLQRGTLLTNTHPTMDMLQRQLWSHVPAPVLEQPTQANNQPPLTGDGESIE